ncbi:MAG: single-stranded-DNA-specific exonuclease RecJ [Proteobacteria bacterium]|nr:single-stranded-DNA-specific exonuclease RecJ [Pseudomonadota bacterium]
MDKRWVLLDKAEGTGSTESASFESISALSGALCICASTARVLINRGITDLDAASRFLNPSLSHFDSPFLLKGMEPAVKRIMSAIDAGERICIYGDYDVDGTSSTALLLLFLRSTGANCSYYIPDRMKEGYGMNCDAVRRLAGERTGLLVTVDNGISSYEEVELANSLGMDVIITDHHQLPPQLPEAHSIINPQQPDCPYPFKGLAGVGVVFNLVMALRSSLRDAGFWKGREEPNIRKYLDLAALGTIADIVPLQEANRTIAVFGMKELSMASRPGTKALVNVSGRSGEKMGTGIVGFQLAPRLNAAGRLSKADTGVRLLTTEDGQEAAALANALDCENRERQEIEKKILQEAIDMVEEGGLHKRPAIVLASEKWHPGVIGIVASRIVEKYYRPALIIAIKDGQGKGSARSIEAFHLFEGLEKCGEHLVSFGGHKYAAGFTLDASNLDAFRQAFENAVSSSVSDEDFIPSLKLDGIASLDDIDDSLVEELERLAPFGASNSEPVFMSQGVEVLSVRVLKDAHLKLQLRQGSKVLDAIAFNMVHKALSPGDSVDVAYSVSFNEWKGRRTVQLKVKDIKLSQNY